MTQEEKAKAYDEAFKKAKQFHDKDLFAECNGNLVEYIFPELAESEDDKVRKAIIGHIKGLRFYDSYYGVTPDEMIAWLENQASKPKWTEEDDYNVNCCIAKVEMVIANDYPCRNQELIEWLKSIKQRMEEQQ